MIAPILFFAHDLEEAFQAKYMNSLMADFGPRLPAPLSTHLVRVRYSAKVVAAVGAASFTAQVALTLASRRHAGARRVLSGLLVVRSANGMMHIAESILARRYLPGMATSPLMVVIACLTRRELRRLDDGGVRGAPAHPPTS